MCVQTCPTGIDIRDGLQMECIHCTQCMDACDTVMDRIGKPRGLIRYASRETLAGGARHLLRPRTVLYPAALTVFLGTFVYQLSTKASADVVLLRGSGAPYAQEPDGRISNQLRLKISNRGRVDRSYRIDVRGAEGGSVIAPLNPLPVSAGRTEVTSLFVLLPATAFHDGEHEITVRISDGARFNGEFEWELLGPRAGERAGAEDRRDGSMPREPR
jgi:cytochrome c oxidase accessory protein FixG